MIKLKLSRPLNAPLVKLSTDIGERFFLLDTGCPISFARRARYINTGEGGWFSDQLLPLERPPLSLTPLSERLGVPVEGFIGLRDMVECGDLYFDFDRGELSLSVGYDHPDITSAQQTETHTLELHQRTHHPITLRGTLDSSSIDSPDEIAASLYLDLGSRFMMASSHQYPQRNAETQCYAVNLITPQGNLLTEVSDGHTLTMGKLAFTNLCVATGAPANFPAILGMEWFTRFNVHLSFTQKKLTLWPRAQAERSSWEELNIHLWAPPFELTFNPEEMNQEDRSFLVMPRPGFVLPPGITPMTPYQLKGFSMPRGPEGVNMLYDAITCIHHNDGMPEPVTLLNNQEEVKVNRVPLFT